MNPDLDLRLKSVLKALTDVILPALPADERMAREQARLVLGHLDIIAAQWKHALKLELSNLALACELASDLAGMNYDSTLGDDLIAALAAAAEVDRGDYDAVSHAHRALKAVIDRLLAPHHAERLTPAMTAAVLRYNARRAERERIWHGAAGLDPDASRLPPIAALFEP
ncbi:MAG: hypothetical protein IPM80_11145 [Proteobacteria bacterium]|nr:hypothetical protein [Pseudomonadota bacterium]